ncbi:hypothetical protein N658DRAFT_506506 [Parathielavia hyrcaniae]|uniref:F-box domain-containing protein n=1 Tax=Parathielavia hyrcaniae TaxID=113614 RepID=A0AAN6Q4X9_9PEZI|nr:hypothetical protein N658DRAFT_506506 [Parathielavia hyrcaniae]
MDCFVAFPFHNCCLDILSDVFAGSGDSRLEGIDKDVLYHVMSCLASELRDGLLLSTVSCFHPILDYGFVSGRDAGKGRWRPLSGEEFSVSNPSATAAVTDELRQSLVGDPVFKLRPETSVLVRNPVLQDPFSRLPNELLMTIARLLSGHDLLALLKASWPALAATRSNGFWKWHLTHEMPWLNSLRPLLDGQEPEEKVTLDYKKLYLWLDKVTAPKYGVDGPFLSLANRRRIWGVCEQLAALYFGHRDVHAATPSDVQ